MAKPSLTHSLRLSPLSHSPFTPSHHRVSFFSPCPSRHLCRATEEETDLSSAGPVPLAVAIAGLVASPVIGFSLYTLKTTGCGLPPGPGGSLGALEGISYLVIAGIVGWSVVTKVRTGSGLPAGPAGLLGAAEGLSYLTLVGILVVFGLQIYETGSLPGPLPSDQCFG
ncbi:hypothetical protein LUZ60_005614 [Juncus effusus]|nr:hypothetical protein LUZ60_005614 [Juncus effusus]